MYTLSFHIEAQCRKVGASCTQRGYRYILRLTRPQTSGNVVLLAPEAPLALTKRLMENCCETYDRRNYPVHRGLPRGHSGVSIISHGDCFGVELFCSPMPDLQKGFGNTQILLPVLKNLAQEIIDACDVIAKADNLDRLIELARPAPERVVDPTVLDIALRSIVQAFINLKPQISALFSRRRSA